VKGARLLLLLALAACGGGKTQAKVAVVEPRRARANPQAVARMVEGIQFAKDPSGRERDKAIELLRAAIAIDPNLWEARYDLGVVLANAGDLAEAEVQLVAATKLDPDAEDAALALGEIRRRRGENRAAADALGDFVDAHPAAVQVRTLYVAALRDGGQVDKAIGQARELLVRKPGDASALAELALCHLAKGEKEEASLLAKQALDANPHSAIADRATGLIALAGGDDAIAFQSFLKATQEDPRDATARLNMGAVLLRAGAYTKAAEQYRAILQIMPEDNEASLGLAAALRGEADAQHPQKYDEARQLLEKILERNPHYVGALFNLGVLYADVLKRPADARPLFKRFLSDAPSDHPSRAEAERYLTTLAAATPPPAPAPPPAPGAPPPPPPPAKQPAPGGH
jgi:tetratricopeptide (TPR) repeat protein